MAIPNSVKDREYRKFIESPSRTSEDTAIEVVVGNDSAIPVFFDEAGTPINAYGSISAVTNASETVILTYTVPTGNTITLRSLSASGTNNSKFTVYIDSVAQETKRSWWSDFNVDFTLSGVKVLEDQVIEIKVKHESAMVADYEAHITGNLV